MKPSEECKKGLTPEEAYDKALAAGKRLPELEPVILHDNSVCLSYFNAYVINRKLEEGELIIAANAHLAYLYALNVIKGRWEEAESIIARDSESAFLYAKSIIKGKWEEGESAIATDAYFAFLYAENIIKGKWAEGESAMATDAYFAYVYAKEILKWRIKGNKEFYISAIKIWENFPKHIKKCPDIMTAYSKVEILK